ncbi:MAG TPA: hypothetical protein VGR24_10280 [bacterium]|jgi:hypothetical protein|nr:hypothetical protein [bacterium]
MPPLTERILSRLPGPTALWIIAWTAAGPLALIAWIGVPPPPEFPLWGMAVVFAYLNCITLWGVRKIHNDLQQLRPLLTRLLQNEGEPDPFKAVGSTAGPLVLTVILLLVQILVDVLGLPRVGSVQAAVLLLIAYLPAATGLWVYFTLFAGLERIGRTDVKLTPHYEDRSLGLRPLGSLAFSAFLLFAAAMGPVVIYATHTPTDAVITLAIIFGGMAVFFVSLVRLRQKQVAEKLALLAWARTLYADAFVPVEQAGSLQAFMDQRQKLDAAEALERRIAAIQEWPFDDSIVRTVAGIFTGLLGAVIARIVLNELGL